MSRVLIVDDNLDNLYLLRAVLQGHGHEVEEAHHGAEALARARRSPPDLVVSDLLMPVMDGYTLLRHWRSDDRLRAIPFVVFTATYTDPKDERLALSMGADAFLLKPTEPDLLVGRIEELLRGARTHVGAAGEAGRAAEDLLDEYSAVVVRKLQEKTLLLTETNRELVDEIAQRRRTERALRETEDRYRRLFHAIQDPLFVYDRASLRFLEVNDAAVTAYGYTREEFLALTVRDLRPPEDVAAFDALLARAGHDFLERGVWRHRRKDGAVIEVEVSSCGIELAGQPACAVQARDVTAHRRAQVELARSTALLQAVADGTPDAVYIKDREGRYLLFNAAACRFTGRSVGEVIGRDDTAIFPPESAAEVMRNDQAVIRSGREGVFEEQLVTPNGSRLFQAVRVPYRGTDGAVIGVIGIARDITGERRAEEALRLRDRAIQAVSQGILITDPNQPDNPIVYASAGFERITGYRASEAVGKNCRFLQGKETDPGAVAALRASIAARRGCTVDILNYRKDGSSFWNQLVVSPVLGADGRPSHFVGVLTDITDRRRFDEHVRQAQKMEAVGQLAGGVAHDFNNLLTVINGYTELVLRRLPPDAAVLDPLHEIRKAGERAGALTRQLLAFSRQQMIEPKLLDLNDVVTQTDRMVRRLIGEDVLLQLSLAPDLGLVRADHGQLEQILVNMAVNARDAMPGGGRLTIETQAVELDESFCRTVPGLAVGAYVLLAVSDTGTGMDEATRARVFEPFFTTKGVGRGTGLGLATVHGIVQQSRGHVAVYSELGFGTTFKIYLPVEARGEPTAPEPAPSMEMPKGQETVLLVEDSDPVRELAVRILERCGYRVLQAPDGREALAASDAEAGPIQLLVSDVVMPYLGGRALAEQLTAKRPDCRVLFLSGYTDDAVIRHGVLEADVAFLQKPFTPASLAQKVRAVLDAPARTT